MSPEPTLWSFIWEDNFSTEVIEFWLVWVSGLFMKASSNKIYKEKKGRIDFFESSKISRRTWGGLILGTAKARTLGQLLYF